MPILGIIASSFRSAAGPEGAYDALATVTLSSTASSVTFSGIPSGYKHLQLRAFLKGTGAGNRNLTFNEISSGYFQHRLEGSGTSASAGGYTSQSQIAMPITGAQWGSVVFDFLDYADVNKNKTVRMLGGYDDNGSGYIGLTSGSVANTSAITSITIAGDTWQIYSSFALYGVK